MGNDNSMKINLDFILDKNWYYQGEKIYGEIFIGENSLIKDNFSLTNITPYIYIEQTEYYSSINFYKPECKEIKKMNLVHESYFKNKTIVLSPEIRLSFEYQIPFNILPTFQSSKYDIQIYHKLIICFPGSNIKASKIIGIMNIPKKDFEKKPYKIIKDIPIYIEKITGILNAVYNFNIQNYNDNNSYLFINCDLPSNSIKYGEPVKFKLIMETTNNIYNKLNLIKIQYIRRINLLKNKNNNGYNQKYEDILNSIDINIDHKDTLKHNFNIEMNLYPQEDNYLMNFNEIYNSNNNSPVIIDLKQKNNNFNKNNYIIGYDYLPNIDGDLIKSKYLIIINFIFNSKFISQQCIEIPIYLFSEIQFKSNINYDTIKTETNYYIKDRSTILSNDEFEDDKNRITNKTDNDSNNSNDNNLLTINSNDLII